MPTPLCNRPRNFGQDWQRVVERSREELGRNNSDYVLLTAMVIELADQNLVGPALKGIEAAKAGDVLGTVLGAARVLPQGKVLKVGDLGKEVAKNEKKLEKALDTQSKSAREALRNAKESNGIPRSAQPDRAIKANTPAGKAAGLDSRNVKQYEYTNSKGEKITIRQDKAAEYGSGGAGDQAPHFNAGQQDSKLSQHHFYED
jgi:HNH/Endo VII superfamily nuclease toxins